MEQSTALAIRRPSTILAVDEKKVLWDMAGAMIKAGMYPQKFKTQDEAFLVALFGHEMGLTPQRAWMELHLIQGQAAPRAHFQVTMAKQHIPGLVWHIKEHTDQICVIEHGRPGEEKFLTDFTINEAKAYGLLELTRDGKKGIWLKDPKAMLYCRAASRAVRWYYPETQFGLLHSVEELTDALRTPEGSKEGIEEAKNGPGRMPKQEVKAEVVTVEAKPETEPSPANEGAALKDLMDLLAQCEGDTNKAEALYSVWRLQHKLDATALIQGYDAVDAWKKAQSEKAVKP